MIKPMLALPIDKCTIDRYADWAIEQKFDGHRLMVEVMKPQGGPVMVEAFTRPRKRAGTTDKTMAPRELPEHLWDAFAKLPQGIYDGELLPGVSDGTATDVTRTDLAHLRRFVMFDVVRLLGQDTTLKPYAERRALLETIFTKALVKSLDGALTLAESLRVTCEADVTTFCKIIWDRGGEGAILKRVGATYQPGKRSKDFIKLKRGEHAVLTVIGFKATRGKVLNRGQFATVLLRDDDGIETSCKTLNDEELEAFELQWRNVAGARAFHGCDSKTQARHPAMGRRLMIAFPMRTRDGNYQGPIMWDRWEDE